MSYTEEIGGKPLGLAGQTNISITVAQFLILPTTPQRTIKGGILQVILSVEAQSARWRYAATAGVANATAALGVLVSAPGVITLRGEQQISRFNIISTVAGGVINYEFSVGDSA